MFPDLLLMGPGPSLVHPRVTAALGRPVLGHMDPAFIAVLDSISEHLRTLFHTQNPFTVALSGTGMSGMEAAFSNAVRPGDRVLIFVNGFFGGRMANIARRQGADVITIEAPWGTAFTLDQIRNALEQHRDVAVVGIVHAETSTGVLQPMAGVGDLVHAAGALLVMDCVTSLGGVPVLVDQWGVDVAYSGSQKCLSCPSGLAPFTVSERALTRIRMRQIPVRSFYFDVLELEKYWIGERRAYHHTASSPLYCALLEGLKLIEEEGLESRWNRHTIHSNAARAGLAKLGFTFFAAPDVAIPHLISAVLPSNVDDAIARKTLLATHRIEVGGGLGDFAGKIWRIGVMGESCRSEHVERLLAAIESVIAR